MACQICGRSSCIKSFHSLEEQEKWDARQLMSDDVDVLRCKIQELEQELKELHNSSMDIETCS